MAEVIRTPAREIREVREREIDSSGTALGWALALILLLAIIAFGIFIWPGLNLASPANTTNPGTNINVSLPDNVVPGTNTNTNTGTQGGTVPTNNTNAGTPVMQ